MNSITEAAVYDPSNDRSHRAGIRSCVEKRQHNRRYSSWRVRLQQFAGRRGKPGHWRKRLYQYKLSPRL